MTPEVIVVHVAAPPEILVRAAAGPGMETAPDVIRRIVGKAAGVTAATPSAVRSVGETGTNGVMTVGEGTARIAVTVDRGVGTIVPAVRSGTGTVIAVVEMASVVMRSVAVPSVAAEPVPARSVRVSARSG